MRAQEIKTDLGAARSCGCGCFFFFHFFGVGVGSCFFLRVRECAGGGRGVDDEAIEEREGEGDIKGALMHMYQPLIQHFFCPQYYVMK